MEARPAEGAAVEMDDERASVAAADQASETDEMEELPAEGEQPLVEARATGPKQTGLEPSSWDDEEELEPETDQDGNPLPPRNVLMTRCRHTQPTRLHSRQPASSLPCAPVAAGASKSTSSTRACTS